MDDWNKRVVQTVWELTGAEGKKTTTRLGGTMTATTTLDDQGQLQNQSTVKAGLPNIRDFGYSFNALTGNLTFRINGLTGLKETFAYDALDRLKSVKEGASEVETMAIGYMDNGNILSKTGLGTYVYDPAMVHAVWMVDYNPQMMPSTPQTISYTSFNKATRLKETAGTDSLRLDISYGPDQQRWKSALKRNGKNVKTIIFAGDYEKFIETDNNNVSIARELYYIGAPDGLAAIYVKPESGTASMYYVHKDHLGSIVSLTDSAGVAVFKASYDAWGKQTVTLNTINFYRGYTGHEHLPEFGLINMNGRMYDPVLGRFLSPDNYVQAADFSQSFNRYSYCVNNPLAYTDPSGEFWHIVIGAAIGGIFNTIVHADQIHDVGDFFMAFGIGAAGGALAAATGGAALGAYGTTAAVSVGAGGFIGGAVAGGVGYTFGTMTTSMGNSMYFGDPMPTGKQLLTGLGVSMLTAGALQGINASLNGRNFLTGNPNGNGIPTPGPRPNLNLDKPTESKINTDGMRSQLKPMPDTPDQLSFTKVKTGGENYSYFPSTGEKGIYVGGPNGQNIKIPGNYYQTPANNGNGIVYRPVGSSISSNSNAIRIMGPTTYAPKGYAVYYNKLGQPFNPMTGQTLPKSLWHFNF